MGSSSAKLEALHKAVVEDDTEKLRELMADDDVDPNARGTNNYTALHLAIANGSLKSVQLLLSSTRVDLSLLTSDKETLLILASAKGHENIALYLLENLPHHHKIINGTDVYGFQVLHRAASKGLERLTGKILAQGTAVDVLGGKLNQTPLMLAADNNQESMVKFLLESGASRTAVDLAKMTPLHHACMANADACVRLLLEGGNQVAVNAKDISGCTPLIYCLNNKNSILEKLLVSHGACLTDALDAGFSTFCYHTLEKR